MKHGFSLAVALLAATPLAAQEYSTAPLATPIAFPRNGMPTEPDQFLGWISAERSEALPPVLAVREHVFALISARLKRRFAETGAATIPKIDTTLAALFDLGTRLGAFGTNDVARALGDSSAAPSSEPIDPEYDLRLLGDRFALTTTSGGWRIEFPYYFMVAMLDRRQSEDGTIFDGAVLSTLTAPDSLPQSGASQATLLIVSTPSTDLARFAAEWLQRLTISPDDTIPRLVPNAMRSYRSRTATDQIWREATVFQIPSGSLVVIYSGLDGTHQANREHYIDLLKSLRVR